MITSFSHVHPSIFVGVLMALAACPQDKTPGTTDAPNEDTTSGTSTSTTTVTPTSSGSASTTTGETTAPSEPGTTSTSSASTTLDPDTTSGGDLCLLDLTPSLALDFDQCDDSLVLIVTVHNVGTLDEAPAGVDVTFYEGTDASGVKLGTKPTTEPLPPGSSTDLAWALPAPPKGESRDYFVEVDPGPNGGSIVECDENNNTALVNDAACPG